MRDPATVPGQVAYVLKGYPRLSEVFITSEIYRLMRELSDHGVGILMISSDMEEVIGVCDRIAVMHEGSISGILDRAEFSEHNVLRLAVGAVDARL